MGEFYRNVSTPARRVTASWYIVLFCFARRHVHPSPSSLTALGDKYYRPQRLDGNDLLVLLLLVLIRRLLEVIDARLAEHARASAAQDVINSDSLAV